MKPLTRFWKRALALTLVAGTLLCAGVVCYAAATVPSYVPNQFIIQVTKGASRASVDTLVYGLNAQVLKALPLPDTYLIKLGRTGATKYTYTITGWAAPTKCSILSVQPNCIRRITVEPDDADYPLQWGMPQINMPIAWDKEKGKDTVTVAVLDTGLAVDHPDLIGRTVPGFNFVENNNNPYPPEDTDAAHAGAVAHGTHVAGIIAAQGDNGIGVCGVCWDGVNIMPIRVADNTGQVSSDAVIQALDFALENGADVVNMSFGGFAPSLAERAKIIELTNAGILCVASTGNSGQFFPDVNYPAAFPECLAVGSVGPTDLIAPYSSYGPDNEVDIVAPGGDLTFGLDAQVWSTTLAYKSVTSGSTTTVEKVLDWGYMQGTSMAAPHVSGAAALLLSAGIPASQVRNELETTARVPLDGYSRMKFGNGVLDVGAALASASIRITKPVKGSTVGARTEFRLALRKIDPTTVTMYLNFVDADGNGAPDDITLETPVITDVTPYLNADGSAATILWPIDGFDPLPKGSNNMCVTANSVFSDAVDPASTTFTVSSSIIPAGIRLAALPFMVDTSVVTPADVLPGTTFGGGGGNPARLVRWIPVPRSLTDANPIGYVTYRPGDPSDIVWANPYYSLSTALTVTTGGSFLVDLFLGSQFQPAVGSGYWLVLSADTAVSDIYPTPDFVTSWDRFKGCTILMYNGWNMFGNPYGHSIPWQSALFTYRGQTKTMQSAADAGWIRSTAFGFDSTKSSEYMRITDRDPLQPLSGYWVRALVGTPVSPLEMILLP